MLKFPLTTFFRDVFELDVESLTVHFAALEAVRHARRRSIDGLLSAATASSAPTLLHLIRFHVFKGRCSFNDGKLLISAGGRSGGAVVKLLWSILHNL